MCYFCLVNAGYESGSWIGVLRDQTHIMLTTVELTLALKLRGHFSYPLSYAFIFEPVDFAILLHR